MSKVVFGKNDLITWCKSNGREDILNDWDYSLNEIKPSSVAYGSAIKVYWKCAKGHSYFSSLNKRTSDNSACPYCACSHAKLLKGFNDLETTNPEILKYWNYEKNESILPSMVMKGQHKKVWWRCERGHSYQAAIYHKVAGRGCPICNKESKSSFPEQAIFYYVKQWFPDAINGDRHLKKELDVFIPSKKIAIEYDGEAWHQDIENDSIKNKLCEENGIVLYRIRERNCWFWTENDYLRLIPCSSGDEKELENAIEVLLILIHGYADVNIERDKIKIYNQYLSCSKKNSLLECNPGLSSEWNVLKNGEITPDMVTVSSGKKFWWLGQCGHEWKASVASRNNSKSGCPYCKGNRLLKGFNDLKTLRPDLLDEWDYNKNDTPENYTVGSSSKVWWICKSCGHPFQMTVNNRAKGHGCKICAKKSVRERYNEGLIIQKKPSFRSDNSSHKKAVINLETGEVFPSMKDAGLKYSISPNKISEVCSGKRKTTGGFHWKCVEQEEYV